MVMMALYIWSKIIRKGVEVPTYTYHCTECDHTFDIVQRITDDRMEVCPRCHYVTLERIITTTSPPVLKGTGWFDKGGY